MACDLPSVIPSETAEDAVLRWLTEGHDEGTVRLVLREHHGEADPDAAVAGAVGKLRDDGEIDPVLIRGWALRAYRDIYRRQMAAGDFDDARKTMREITLLVR